MASPACNNTCPFLQESDLRCAQRFNLNRLDEIFQLCLHDHGACEIYHQIRVERMERRHAITHAVG